MTARPSRVTAKPPTRAPTTQPGTERRKTRLPSSRTISRLNCLGLRIVSGQRLRGTTARSRPLISPIGLGLAIRHWPSKTPPSPRHHAGGSDVAVHPGRPLEVDPLGRPHVAGDLAVHLDPPGPDVGLNHSALADDQGVLRADLALEPAVEHHRPAESV